MGRSELRVGSVCCLLHNLVPGGSAWQWIHLLGRHVQRGGRATILAPPGPLAEPARAAGIEVTPTSWDENEPARRNETWSTIERHEAAIVHWDHRVMDAFVPALELCGRAALAIHQAPHALARWFGPEILPGIRAPLEAAVSDDRAVALVRGESHRRLIAAAFDLPPERLRVLPASIPLEDMSFQPAAAEPQEVLALTRLSPDKEAIALLAIELVRARQEAGRPCRLAIAGDGPMREDLTLLCEERLPAGPWRVERAPRDPVARLAAADLVVAQGLTTLEAAALGKRVVVARMADAAPAGAVLTPQGYDLAARDPFGKPPLNADPVALWRHLLEVDERDLRRLRRLVEKRNSLRTASRALGKALKATA